MTATTPPVNRDIPKAQDQLFDAGRSAGAKYAALVVGRPGLGALVGYELVMLLSQWVPGALGLVLRKALYPRLLGACGRRVVFGQHVGLRHPHKIIERLPGVDRVLATGQNDPELRVEFSPFEVAARGLTAAQIADTVRAWFRDTFAGRARVGEDDWLVRVIGQQADADYLGRLSVLSPALNSSVPLSSMATVETARARASSLASSNGQSAVILAVTKKSKVNTLNLVADINRYLAEREPALKQGGFELMLFDDQTVPTKQAIGVMETNAVIGLLIVLVLCWLFLGSRLAVLVSLGIPFSLAGTFAILYAFDFTLSIPVLLGIVIALGMLVDDAMPPSMWPFTAPIAPPAVAPPTRAPPSAKAGKIAATAPTASP